MVELQSIEEFLRAYPEHVREIAEAARVLINQLMPDAQETLDVSAKVIGYGLGPGYKGLVYTLILSKQGVKLGIFRGAELPDPDGLMAGSGKIHRHVQLTSVPDATHPNLTQLMERALAAWRARNAGTVI